METIQEVKYDVEIGADEMIDAIKYKVEICLDFEHNHYTHVTEIFIPEVNIAFNYFNNQLNVFECKTPRYLTTRTGEKTYPLEYVEQLMKQNSNDKLKYTQQQQKIEDRFQKNQMLADPTITTLSKEFAENLVTYMTLKPKIEKQTSELFSTQNN
jgi:ribosomal protein S17E